MDVSLFKAFRGTERKDFPLFAAFMLIIRHAQLNYGSFHAFAPRKKRFRVRRNTLASSADICSMEGASLVHLANLLEFLVLEKFYCVYQKSDTKMQFCVSYYL